MRAFRSKDHLNKKETKKLAVPQERLISVSEAEPEWFMEGIDPLCHERALHLTRGIHLLNEWWKEQSLQIAFPVGDNASYLLQGIPGLESAIRKLHKLQAPCQKIDDCEFVIGGGATQVINAFFYALSVYHSLRLHPNVRGTEVPLEMLFATQQTPGYVEVQQSIEMLHNDRMKWVPFGEHKHVPPDKLLEFITTPNNPDGRICVRQTNAAYTVHDRVNHWSIFLQEDDSSIYQETLENDWVSIFSLVKFLSFSGSRVGYAFVRDRKLAHFMRYFIIHSSHGLSRAGQVHCLKALLYILDGKFAAYTERTQTKLRDRWQRLKKALSGTEIKLLNSQGPNAWIQSPSDAQQFLAQRYHIEATYGPEYGADPTKARLNMLAQSHVFDEALWRFTHL